MVFESLVVDLVNRYLGDFIENLDSSQLKIGIWGGDVVLKNLYVKESALDDLDLPIKVRHGNLGKLTLKIPWKNLYSEPTVATLEGLYVVAVPNADIAYNEEKEKQAEFEAKQKELQRIEEAKKQEAAKGKAVEEKQDSFAEKLATNVIKNLQIHISDIHIRYEDSFTNPSKPFSIGVTLKQLMFQTTDADWRPTVIKDAVTMIYKMVQLDSLAVYWNCRTDSYLGSNKEEMLRKLNGSIICAGGRTDYTYLVEPITSSAKLRLHTHPEKDNFSLAKLLLALVFEQIAIGLTKQQYQDIMELLEAQERMNLATKFRKYHPRVARKGHSKEWWHFAYKCILEETVRRRRRMWSWQHIRNHRQLCRSYKDAYKKKLSMKKLSKDIQDTLDKCERELSVFNLTLVRKQAEMEAKKEGLKKEKDGGGGWFGGWFGGGKKEEEKKKDATVGEQFEKLMTSEEKAKLYDAIGYSEANVDPTLPKEYVAHEVHFELKNLSLALKDTSQVLNLQLQQLQSDIGQRPSANGLNVQASVGSFTMLGMPPAAGLPAPVMIASQLSTDNTANKLIDLGLEVNPLDGGCDTRINLSARPLEVVYNAATVNNLANFFKPPESVHLKQLQSMAMEQLETIKDQTVASVQRAIEVRKYTEINVNIMPTHVIVPEKGVYKPNESRCLVLDLGELSISTQKQQKVSGKPELMSFFTKQLTIDDVMDQAYDKFRIWQKSVQLLFVNPGEDWISARNRGSSHMHILSPMDLIVNLEKCMIQDHRFAKLRVNAELPSINMGLSDVRMKEILDIVQSIPLPESGPQPPVDPLELDAPDLRGMASEGKADRLIRDMGGSESGYSSTESSDDESAPKVKKSAAVKKEPSLVNATDVELKFEIKEICFSIAQRINKQDVPLLKLIIDSLGTEVKVRTFDLAVSAYLGGIYLQHTQFRALEEGPLVNLINTPITDDSQYKLLHVEVLMANPKGPEFASTYNSTVQKIDARFTALELLLHQEALISVLDFAKTLKPPDSPPSVTEAEIVPQGVTGVASAPTGDSHGGDGDGPKTPRSRRKKAVSEVIDLMLNASLDEFSVALCNKTHPITDIKVKGLNASVSMQKSKIEVEAGLKNLAIYDPTPNAMYPQILMFKGDEVFSSRIVVYNQATDGENYAKMECVDTSVSLNTGCMQVVFLNKFVVSLQNFADSLLSQTAKDKIAEASAAAAETATKTAQDIAQKSPRVKLDIKLKAPVVVVPQKSTSENALIVDLGLLDVSNVFKIAPAQDSHGVPAVLDQMTVKLTSLKLSRALMMGADMVAECLLLEPVTLRVDINRNLAASWYHGEPDVAITGKLEKFSVSMSQGDFTCVMSLLNENLQEGAPASPAPVTPVTVTPADQAGQKDTVTATQVEPVAAQQTQLSPEESSHSKLKFKFSIQSLSAELYTGDSNLVSGVAKRDPLQALARFELQLIDVLGNMHPDSAMEASVILHRCVLFDKRPGRDAGITRMVDVSSVSTAASDNMIDVVFAQSANQNKELEVKINGLYICVYTEYLMALADFFVKGMPQQPAVTPPPASTAPPSDTAEPTKAAASPPPPGEITVTLNVNKPEIVLVEDAMNVNTNALILDVEVFFKLRMSPEIQTMMGSIKGLQIISCVYAMESRESSKALILHPTDINLHSSAPQGKGHHMDVMVTDVIMNISPATIRTLVATFSGLAAKSETGEVSSLEQIPHDLWAVKKVKDCEFWFLKSDVSKTKQQLVTDNEEELAAARRVLESETEEVDVGRGEQLIVTVNRIVVKLEGGVGKRTVPFIITEMGFKGEVCNWSSKLYVDSELCLEVAYYNEKMAAWEPILEPVEENGMHRPWEIKAVIQTNDMFALDDLTDGDDDKPVIPAPKMTINVIATDILEATLTKSCLEVLSNLGKSFGDAYMLVDVQEKPGEVVSPYFIKNDSGIYVKVKLDDSFKEPDNAVDGHIEMEPGDSLQIFSRDDDDDDKHLGRKKSKSILAKQDEVNKSMYLVMEDFGATRELRVVKAEKRAYNINMKAYPKDTWQLVSQIDSSYGCKSITLRSILQVVNHMPFSMELYYKLSDDAMGRCGEVAPGQSFNVPCDAVYSAPYELYVKPHDTRYQESKDAIKWKTASSEKPLHISCKGTKPDINTVFCSGRMETEQIWLESTGQRSATLYTLHLSPSVFFRNLLPMPVSYLLSGMETHSAVQGGEKVELLEADIHNSVIEIKIENYLDKEWIGRLPLSEKPQDLAIITFDAMNAGSNKVSIDLGVHTNTSNGYHEVALYCPYWMINKTGRELTYKAGDDFSVAHPADISGIVLFSFRSKSFFGKKKDDKQNGVDVNDEEAQPTNKTLSLSRKSSSSKKKSKPKTSLKKTVKASLKISESEWSDKFSLDTVGSAGTVSCKFKGYNLEVGVKIALTSSGLTKICTFTPYFMLNNKASFGISCKEVADSGVWCDVSPGECIPFWPAQTGKNPQMTAKISGTEAKTKPFLFTEPHTTLLQVKHEYGGINVATHITESTVTVELEEYKPGFASVLLVNSTESAVISYSQRDIRDGMNNLGPQDTVLYTWDDPTGKREIVWEAGEKKNQKDDLVKDGIGDFLYNSDMKLYWVSFLDGMQRVLLFTEDIAVATAAQQAGELERLDQEINVSLQGLGLSLVNNQIQKEVAYMGIRCSGVIWEEKKKKRFKALKMKQSAAIEEAYDRWTTEVQLGKATSTQVTVAPKLDVDFGENPVMIVKNHRTPIRRSFQYGMWIQYRQSAHQLQCHLKIHRLQLDNQLPGAVFPTVLAPIPPPKSVAAESVPKPFTELSLMIRKREFTKVMQFKYAKVLIQEMAVKVDQGFINAMIGLFSQEAPDEAAQMAAFKEDCKLINVDLSSDADQVSADENRHFYDMLHFSPLKIHLSFSLYGSAGDEENKKPAQLHSNVLNLFLQSVGIVLTDIQDVVFKLGYFERNYNFYTQSQLQGQITRHYSSQAIKQMYVLVLGLDVLGNPFGVIRGMAQGIEDFFYEPYQGAIQGPEEFAEGLALGVRSLLGHAVGGAAGAVSRITGALGKGIATLTLDDEYQRKRREQLNKRPADLREGLARGGKGLVMGVVDGVTGIVRKPVQGAKEEGVGGFFKGVGKGLVGAFTRPASGVVDFASSSFEGIRRVAEMSDEVRRQRPPRFIHKDGVIHPYSFQEAQGNDILQDVEKGRYAATDQYEAFLFVTADTKHVLLVTNKRVMFVSKGEIFGHWNYDWSYTWEELKEPPVAVTGGIQILLKEKQKKSFFSSGTVGKRVALPDPKACEWLVSKMKNVMTADQK